MADLRDTIRALTRPAATVPAPPPLERPPPVPRGEGGKWVAGQSANPGGRPKWRGWLRRQILDATQDGWLIVEGLIEQVRTGIMTRPDGSFVRLTPKDDHEARKLLAELLMGKTPLAVTGTVKHTGKVGVDVKGSVALDYDMNRLAKLSDADFERLEALASVLMPQPGDIVDAEVYPPELLPEPESGDGAPPTGGDPGGAPAP